MYHNIYMDKLNIIKIILIFFILKIILKSNKLEPFAVTPSNTFPVASTQPAPKKPWDPGFKYGGKDTAHFKIENDKIIGSASEKLFDDPEEPDLKTNCTINNIAYSNENDKKYIYLDERYSTDDVGLPYRTINKVTDVGLPKFDAIAQSYDTIKKDTDFINILLPNVKKEGDGESATYTLEEPSIVRLSYTNKKIDLGYTPKDLSQANDCKVYDPSTAVNPSDSDTKEKRDADKTWSAAQKVNCFQHNGYCSFVQCEEQDSDGNKINLCE
jgi:hypothetical protein